MDIRNIKVEEYTGLNHLEFIFEKGKEQLEKYMGIEKLPMYPIDINTKKSQIILKDFIGRVVEELAEGYESLQLASDILDKYGWNIQNMPKDDYVEVLNNLANANEEQADAMGFFVTLLLYANILPEDIASYKGSDTSSLNHLMAHGVSIIWDGDQYKEPRGYNLLDTDLLSEYGLDYDKIINYTPGFTSISPAKLEQTVAHLWKITYQLNLARNFLKNRPWKQSPVMSKELDFQETLVKAFYSYLGYLAYNDYEEKSITNLFYRKQQLNLWRIKTGY